MKTKKAVQTQKARNAVDSALQKAMQHPGVKEVMDVYEAARKFDGPCSTFYLYQHPQLPSTVITPTELRRQDSLFSPTPARTPLR